MTEQPPPPASPSNSTASPSGGSIKKILTWNFVAAVLVALVVAACNNSSSDTAVGIGVTYFFGFPLVNVILLVITAFRKSGTRSALLGFLLVSLIMPLIGFFVCASGMSGMNFH